MGVLDDAADPVPVANFPPASVDDIESAISEDNCETTITNDSAYSLGVGVFATDQLQYYLPIRNVEGAAESVAEERFSLDSISAITDDMAVGTKQSRMKKISHGLNGKNSTHHSSHFK